MNRLRTAPIALPAAVVAVSAAWALRGQTGPPPTPATRAHAVAGGIGHHGAAVTLPPPVLGDSLANTAGLAFLVVLPAAAGIAIAAVLARRYLPNALAFAVGAGLAAAGVTVTVAAVALAGAVSFPESVAAAVLVLRNTFVVVVGVCALGGVPWRAPAPIRTAKV
ncbi:MAG TPA: hypothetical protein VM677_29695 [Actinokineospora sp.]|nr:hypothetical protein [Actinokineospora sp.]